MSKFNEYLSLIPKGIKNIPQIIDGIYKQSLLENNLLPEDERDEIVRRRIICFTCPFMSENAKLNGYNTERTEQFCTCCGCPINTKTASLSSNCGIEDMNEKHPEKPQIPLKWQKYIK